MPVCVPIKDLKDTAKFAKLVEESSGPITVTKNGYDAFVVMRSADYDRLASSHEEEAKQKLLARIAIAERELAEGKFTDYDSATQKLRDKYGL